MKWVLFFNFLFFIASLSEEIKTPNLIAITEEEDVFCEYDEGCEKDGSKLKVDDSLQDDFMGMIEDFPAFAEELDMDSASSSNVSSVDEMNNTMPEDIAFVEEEVIYDEKNDKMPEDIAFVEEEVIYDEKNDKMPEDIAFVEEQEENSMPEDISFVESNEFMPNDDINYLEDEEMNDAIFEDDIVLAEELDLLIDDLPSVDMSDDDIDENALIEDESLSWPSDAHLGDTLSDDEFENNPSPETVFVDIEDAIDTSLDNELDANFMETDAEEPHETLSSTETVFVDIEDAVDTSLDANLTDTNAGLKPNLDETLSEEPAENIAPKESFVVELAEDDSNTAEANLNGTSAHIINSESS